MAKTPWIDLLDTMHLLIQEMDAHDIAQTAPLWAWVLEAHKSWPALYKSEGQDALQAALGDDGVEFALPGWRDLCKAATLTPFAWIHLGSASVGPRALGDPRMQQVVSLTLDHKVLQSDHVNEIRRNPHLSCLHTLSLKHCKLPGYRLDALAKASALSAMRHLDLSFNALGPMSSTALSSSSWIRKLETLNLSANPLRDKGVATLLSKGRFEQLTRLGLSGCKLGDESVKWMATTKNLSCVEQLDLSDNNISDEGAKQLTQGTMLGALTDLNLSGNVIRDAGADVLAQYAQLRELTTLDLSRNPIGLASMPEDSMSPSEQSTEATESWSSVFGHLRSVLASYPAHSFQHHDGMAFLNDNHTPYAGLGDSLMTLLEDISARFPVQYKEQVVPYVERAHRARPLVFKARDWEELKRFSTIAPFARFDFDGERLNLKQIKHPLMEAVDALDLSRKIWSGKQSQNVLAQTTSLAHVRVLDMSGLNSDEGFIAAMLGSVSPALEHLRFEGTHFDVNAAKALLESSQVNTLTSLSIRLRTAEEGSGFDYLCQHGEFPTLRRVELSGRRLSAVDIERMFAAPLFDHVDTLVIDFSWTNGDLVAALVSGFAGRTLRTLKMRNAIVSDDDFVTLFESPVLAHLEQCSFRRSSLGELAAQVLSEASCVASLKHLYLNGDGMDERHLDLLFGDVAWPALEGLALPLCACPERGADVLASASLERLEIFSLWPKGMEQKAIERLTQAPWMSHLIALSLYDCELKDQGVESLVRADLSGLQYLALGHNHVGPKGAQALAQACLPSLQLLRLGGNPIGDEGLESIMTSSSFEALRGLSVSDCSITRAGALALSQNPSLGMLEMLDISQNRITPKGRQALSETPYMHPRRLANWHR